ncbi:MAG: hypothetical protein BWY31_00185 [Lentisphaerae bacterium ADurb.Bin242]|nr:MAG: hypothetical protein BWY31_00185 [Lentisphaerae bacterium ADurb.Bin242]
MKKTCLYLGLLAVLPLAGMEPMMKTVDKELKRDSRVLREKQWNISFGSSGMVLRNLVDLDGGRLIRQKWGDYFFGLSHGSVNNGSWCGWNFFSCAGTDGKSIPENSPVRKVTLVKFSDGSAADFLWDGLSIRMIQFSGVKDWVFMRVKSAAPLKSVIFRAWPGGAHWEAPGRERRLKIADKDFDLTRKQVDIPLERNGLALYNRNYSEEYGNYLVFEADKYDKLTGYSDNSVSLTFFPKKDQGEFHFALGYFFKEPPADAISRFLVERLPNIEKMLRTIDWNPAVDVSSFESGLQQTRLLLSKLDPGAGTAFSSELELIEKAFRKARSENDASGCAEAQENLRKLRVRIGEQGLARFR